MEPPFWWRIAQSSIGRGLGEAAILILPSSLLPSPLPQNIAETDIVTKLFPARVNGLNAFLRSTSSPPLMLEVRDVDN